MRYKNEGPITVYAIINTISGDIVATRRNLALARAEAAALNRPALRGESRARVFKVLTYDQRGTR